MQFHTNESSLSFSLISDLSLRAFIIKRGAIVRFLKYRAALSFLSRLYGMRVAHYYTWHIENHRSPCMCFHAEITCRHFFLFPKTCRWKNGYARCGGMWKTGSHDKSTITCRAKYKFSPTIRWWGGTRRGRGFVFVPMRDRGKKIINALPSSTLDIGHGHHMVRYFRRPVGFVDPRAGNKWKRANRRAARCKSIESLTAIRPWIEIAIVIHLIVVIRYSLQCDLRNTNNNVICIYYF